MAALNITITDAGKAEIINAVNTGTDPVTIAEVGIGSGKYAPDPTQTALVTETKRLTTIAGLSTNSDTIHLTIKDESADAYAVSEIGLYTADGTLFAVYSDPVNDFLEKTATSTLLISLDIVLSSLDAASITFGDTSFANPSASETTQGVASIATQAETDAGTNDTKFITAKKLKAWVKQATESVLGMMKIATQAQTDAGTNDSVAVTPKKMRWGFSAQFSTFGYIVFPTWMGAGIVQWGRYISSASSGGSVAVTFPLAFLNGCFAVTSNNVSNTTTPYVTWIDSLPSKTGFSGRASSPTNNVLWIAIGN